MSAQQDKNQTGSSDGSAIANGLAKLNKALDALDSSVDANIESHSKVRSADEEVQRMANDRTRLAKELDSAEASAARLIETNKEVSKRLVGAMETVREVLEADLT